MCEVALEKYLETATGAEYYSQIAIGQAGRAHYSYFAEITLAFHQFLDPVQGADLYL